MNLRRLAQGAFLLFGAPLVASCFLFRGGLSDLEVIFSDPPPTAFLSDDITYHVQLWNHGSRRAKNFKFTLRPNGGSLKSFVYTPNYPRDRTSGACAKVAADLNCSFSEADDDGQPVAWIDAVITAPSLPGSISVTAEMTISAEQDRFALNNRATVTTNVIPKSLSCQATPPAPLKVGDPVSLDASCTGGLPPFTVRETSGTFAGSTGTGVCSGATLSVASGTIQIRGAFAQAGNCTATFRASDSDTPARTTDLTVSWQIAGILACEGSASAQTATGDPLAVDVTCAGGRQPLSATETTGSFSGSGAGTGACSGATFVMNGSAVQFRGAFAQAGSCTAAIQVTDAGTTPQVSAFTRSWQIFAPLHITTTALAIGDVNTSFARTISTTGGSGLVSFAVKSGQLPPGVFLNSTAGTLSGTPSLGGHFTFEIEAVDAQITSQIARQTYGADVLEIETTQLADANVDVPYSVGVQTRGNVSGTWSVLPVAGQTGLPTGLALGGTPGANATITGTPLEAGVFTFTLEVRSGSASDTQVFTIRITGGWDSQ